jgi:hypothetical protein
MNRKSLFAAFVLVSASPTVSAREWTPADLVQKARISCELKARAGTDSWTLGSATFDGHTPFARAAVEVRAIFDGRSFTGRLLHLNGSAYLALEEDGFGALDELMRAEFRVNEEIWVTPQISTGRELSFRCAFRGERGKDLGLHESLTIELGVLEQGLKDVRAGLAALPPFSAPHACHRLGVSVLRSQRLAERSLGPAPGLRASSALASLRNAVSGEATGLCRGLPLTEELRAALARLDAPLAEARAALAPEAP